MAVSLKWLYLKREFEVALILWLLWCACILIFGQTYNLYIILACTEVNNGIWGSHQNWQGLCRMVNLSSQPLHGAIQKGRPFYCPLILSFNLPEHLNVTTFLASSIIASPVTGFLPLRSFFSFIQKLPNPFSENYR